MIADQDPSSSPNEDGSTSSSSGTGGPRGPDGGFPDSGDASGGSVDPAAIKFSSLQIDQDQRELTQAIRHRAVYFYLAVSIIVTFFGSLLWVIFNGTPTAPAALRVGLGELGILKISFLTDGPTHVYLTKLAVLALIPTAVMIRLAIMVRREPTEKSKVDLEGTPLASVTVATEMFKAMADVAKSFGSKG
jgi:hypothetical protein